MSHRLLRLALAVPLIALVGCEDGVPAGKIPLRYMAWGTPEQIALEKEFCERFNAENPDLHVKFVQVPNSAYANKAIVMMASRTAPDVLRIDHYLFPSLVKRNYFYDMTELAAKDKTFRRDDFFPQAIREGTYEGRLYGLNVLFGATILYYNKKMIREAGLEDPYQLWKRGEWTYERFQKHAVAMTKLDERGKPVRFGCSIPGFPSHAFVVWGFGGDLLSKDGKRCLLGEPPAVEAYQFLSDLRWKHRCAPTPAQGANAQFTFESGKLGMEFEWMGRAPRLRTIIKDFDWDVCPVPSGPKASGTLVKGNQLVIYRESKYPEAAWRFVRFMTGPEVERALYVGHRRSAPSRRALAYSKEFLNAKSPPYQMDTFLKSLEGGRELPITDRWAEWTTPFTSELDNLFSGRERDAAKVLHRAAAKANEVLADEEGF